MIVQIAKDYKHYEVLYESQEEAQAVVDYLDEILTSGVPSICTGKAYFQHEQEASTGNEQRQP